LILNVSGSGGGNDHGDIVKMADQDRGAKFVCPNCPYVSDRKSKVRRHIDSQHRRTDPVYCAICEKRASNVHALKSHMLRYHRDSVV
jgi:hypothetical protein